MASEAHGYKSGDNCPRPDCNGIIEIRRELANLREYAQCSRCHFNTFDKLIAGD